MTRPETTSSVTERKEPTALDRAIGEYTSVGTWSQGLQQQWGGDPLAEEPDKLDSLVAFCEFVDKDPDQLVAFCFLRKKATGQRFASVQRRDAVASELRRFRTERGLRGLQARRLTSHVLSFLIHNGVMMNAAQV